MIDSELVTRKLTLILQDLPALTDLARKSPAEYLDDPTHQVLTERYLERTIGRMIDVNYHLITELGHPPPKDYHESFVTLGTLKILPAEFARVLAVAAGLRNRIVHEYDESIPASCMTPCRLRSSRSPFISTRSGRAFPPE
ncbi:type VII toxin-antitoxin system HepT family RNase toxin [Nitrospira sp. Nam80]